MVENNFDFTTQDVADYYNQTQNHYETWWKLGSGMSLHYGVWEKDTPNFLEALRNTNRIMMNLAGVEGTHKVLDAGCGVGGAAIFMAQQKGAAVQGITVSETQVAYGNQKARELGVSELVQITQQDYTKTNFPDESFDVVWACESVSSAPQQVDFIKEAYRVLKKGGKLVMADCFLTTEDQADPNEWIKKWGSTWAVSGLVTKDYVVKGLTDNSFTMLEDKDFTTNIVPTARRMYQAYLLGAIPSRLYNFFFKKTRRFAKIHYLSGLYQYKSLKADLWKYNILVAQK